MTLESLGYRPFFSAQFELLERPDLVPARVMAGGQDSFHLAGARALLGELSGKLRHELRPIDRPVVGDWLAVADAEHRAIVHHVLDRRTALVRRAAGSSAGGQVIAANVDVFFIVTSANRDFNIRRLERYLAAVWDSGADPVVVLNKVDLDEDIDDLLRQIDSVGFGLPVLATSAATGRGLDELRARVPSGTTAALIGSSGVGKSSIINRLLGADGRAIDGLRNDDKGRHTTSRRELVELPGGGLLADTPGMRELGLIDDSGGLDAGFPDIAALAAECRFANCEHAGEPRCAVEAAVNRGDLARDRLASYHKLQRELAVAAQRQDPTVASRPKRRWKAIHKAIRAQSKVDPKHKP